MNSDLTTVLDRAFKTIEILQNPVTIKNLQEQLQCSHSCAWKYMQAASIALPVVCLNEEERGKNAMVFQLLTS